MDLLAVFILFWATVAYVSWKGAAGTLRVLYKMYFKK